jgi:hypothetical protein
LKIFRKFEPKLSDKNNLTVLFEGMSLETCCLCGLQTGNPFDMEGHIESEHKDIYKSSINQSENNHKIEIYKPSLDTSENIESEHKNSYKSSITQSDNIESEQKISFVKSSLNQSEKEENLKFSEILSVTSEDQTKENSIIIQNTDAGDNFNIIIRLGFRCLKVKSNPGKASENDRGIKFQKIESIKILLI